MNDGIQDLSKIQCDPIDGMSQSPQKMPKEHLSQAKQSQHVPLTWNPQGNLSFHWKIQLLSAVFQGSSQDSEITEISSQTQNSSKQKFVLEGNFAWKCIIHKHWIQLLIPLHQRILIFPVNSVQITGNHSLSRTRTSVYY